MKRRNPTSKIYFTALYLHHVKGQTEFTLSQLHDAQEPARAYYHSRLSDDWLTARTRILEEHGFPGVECDYTLTEYLSLYPFTYQVYGYPGPYNPDREETIDFDALNAALYNLLRHSVIIDEPTFSPNIFTGNVKTQYERGYLERNDKCSPFIYSLPERYNRHWLFAACNGFDPEVKS